MLMVVPELVKGLNTGHRDTRKFHGIPPLQTSRALGGSSWGLRGDFEHLNHLAYAGGLAEDLRTGLLFGFLCVPCMHLDEDKSPGSIFHRDIIDRHVVPPEPRSTERDCSL